MDYNNGSSRSSQTRKVCESHVIAYGTRYARTSFPTVVNRYRVPSMNLRREKVGPLIGHSAITIVESAAARIPCRHV